MVIWRHLNHKNNSDSPCIIDNATNTISILTTYFHSYYTHVFIEIHKFPKKYNQAQCYSLYQLWKTLSSSILITIFSVNSDTGWNVSNSKKFAGISRNTKFTSNQPHESFRNKLPKKQLKYFISNYNIHKTTIVHQWKTNFSLTLLLLWDENDLLSFSLYYQHYHQLRPIQIPVFDHTSEYFDWELQKLSGKKNNRKLNRNKLFNTKIPLLLLSRRNQRMQILDVVLRNLKLIF